MIERLHAALADRYVIEQKLGEGGMATVFLAEDLRHHRKVALKVLKPELAAVVGADRFLSEIETTARLQHPHILPLFDSGEADHFLFYVMPFVEGESLADRLAREHQLPVDEAVRVAIDLAEALAYAHTHGVIHRDIKPANILLHAGRAVIADFGIALAARGSDAGRLTETGLSLGTPVYMSPEQAAGEPFVTPSADIYSLGCVLYEMLVGEPPFTGRTAQAVLGRVMTSDAPTASVVRGSVPPNVDAAIAKALEKLPADRFASAAAFASALADPAFRHGTGPSGDTGGGGWKRATLATGAALVIACVVAAAGWLRPQEPHPVSRYALRQSPEEAIPDVFGPSLAFAPDGSSLVYVGRRGEAPVLWVKERDAVRARPLPGTEGGVEPAFFPDGRRVAFLTLDEPDPRAVKVVDLETGEVVTLRSEGFYRNGLTVGPDGTVYLNIADGVSIGAMDPSGTLAPVTTRKEGEHNHIHPHVLPGGRGLLFNIQYGSYRLADADVAVVDLSTGEHRILLEDAVMPVYAASGHLLAVRPDGTLVGAPFDERRLELTGPVVPLFEGVDVGLTQGVRYGADISISLEGSLAYVSAEGAADEGRRQLEWVSEDGGLRTVAPDWTANFESVAVAPSGDLLAVTVGVLDSTSVWILDLESGVRSALSFTSGMNRRPVWSPDGREVFFISDRGGRRAVHSRRVDGSGAVETVLEVDGDVDEVQISGDGEWLVYRTGTSDGNRDVFALRRGADPSEAVVISALPGVDEFTPMLSPDGRFVAYVSNETGEELVWVRTFPDPGEGRWRISSGAGYEPSWAPDGSRLFFRSAEGLMAVDVLGVPSFRTGPVSLLFAEGTSSVSSPYLVSGVYTHYDVHPETGDFIFARMPEAQPSELIVVENFFAELDARVGR